MEFTIPVFDAQVDTDDWGRSARNVAGAVAGGIGLLGIAGVAKFGYERITSAAGVNSGLNIGEGV
jgi:hypothetical protein